MHVQYLHGEVVALVRATDTRKETVSLAIAESDRCVLEVLHLTKVDRLSDDLQLGIELLREPSKDRPATLVVERQQFLRGLDHRADRPAGIIEIEVVHQQPHEHPRRGRHDELELVRFIGQQLVLIFFQDLLVAAEGDGIVEDPRALLLEIRRVPQRVPFPLVLDIRPSGQLHVLHEGITQLHLLRLRYRPVTIAVIVHRDIKQDLARIVVDSHSINIKKTFLIPW